MKTFAVLVLLLATVYAQPIQPRCTDTPPEWFGYFREVNYDARPGEVGFRFANISYSRIERKIKVIQFERREGDTQHFEVETDIYLYTEKVHYTVEKGHCRKSTIPEENKFPDFGIPEGATFFGIDYLGAKATGLGVLVDQFHHRDESGGDYHGSFAPLSSAAYLCLPVIESFVNRSPPSPRNPTASSNIQFSFYNLTTVLPLDPFSIPRECTEQINIRGRPTRL